MSMTITGAELGAQLMACTHRPESARFNVARFGERQSYLNKPEGGLWTSTLKNGESDWVRWCRVNEFGSVDDVPWWRLEPSPSATLLHIDDDADFHALMDAFGRDVPVLGRVFDFDKMKQCGYAGVHVTERAVAASRWPWGTGMGSLDAWDCESTVWLRWSFVSATDVLMNARQGATGGPS